MSQQQDLPESANIQFSIAIDFFVLGLENIETDLATTLENLKDGGKILQYSILTDTQDDIGGVRYYTDLSPFDVLGRVAVQVTTEIAKGISENKNTLDILTDLATIFGVTLPLVRKVLTLLQKEKGTEHNKKVPYVRITVGRCSIEVNSTDLKESEESALRLAERFLEKHPNAKASNKVKINSGLWDPIGLAKTPLIIQNTVEFIASWSFSQHSPSWRLDLP